MLIVECDAVSRNINARCPVQSKMTERERATQQQQKNKVHTINDVARHQNKGGQIQLQLAACFV